MANPKPSGPSGPLAAKELAAIAAKLDARHRALLEEIRDELEKSENQQYIELVGNVPTDVGDQSVGDALADLELAIIDRHVTELRDLEAARGRMRKGGFGICIACGTEVGYERLLAYPTAMRCLACQEQHERTYAHGGTPTL